MKRLLLTLAMAAALGMPALAMDAMSPDQMSCADFTAMDAAGQMQSMGSMTTGDAMSAAMSATGTMSAKGGMMATDTPSGEEMARQAKAACAGHPDMTVAEAIKASKM